MPVSRGYYPTPDRVGEAIQANLATAGIQTEIVTYPFRFGHVCPASDGASAIVIADESLALKKDKQVAWFKGLASYTDEENQLQSENFGGVGVTDPSEQRGCWLSAMKAYKQAGIVDPSKEIDVAEIYQPFPSQELFFAERLGLFDESTAWMALERGETEITGRMPCDPSGGVNATNAIGSSAMQRILECALQIMGKAEEHQVRKGRLPCTVRSPDGAECGRRRAGRQ
jgi:acetyl-CoA C-acetyltransferase